jgi:RNA-binding protein
LIEVRVNASDREARAELVQSLGHVITLFRKSPEQGKKA